jgi:DNA polymerase
MNVDADPSLQASLAALVDWYVSVGVDLAVDDTPHDRFVESAAPPAPAPSPVATSTRAPVPEKRAPGRAPAAISTGEASREAQAAAAGAESLAELAVRLAAFDGCALKATAGHFIFAAGAAGAPLMALDFAPGEEEERSGTAFVGPEARLLDNMLKAIGRDRTSVYLAYATPWRPPGAREPNAGEVAVLHPFLRRHVALAAPKALLILGDYAARAALGSADVAKLRGQWFDYDCGGAPVRALFMPALVGLLKTPIVKRRVWRDLRALAAVLG